MSFGNLPALGCKTADMHPLETPAGFISDIYNTHTQSWKKDVHAHPALLQQPQGIQLPSAAGVSAYWGNGQDPDIALHLSLLLLLQWE